MSLRRSSGFGTISPPTTHAHCGRGLRRAAGRALRTRRRRDRLVAARWRLPLVAASFAYASPRISRLSAARWFCGAVPPAGARSRSSARQALAVSSESPLRALGRAPRRRDQGAAHGEGWEVESFNGSLLFEPSASAQAARRSLRVFTPFWRACLASASRPSRPCPPRPGFSARRSRPAEDEELAAAGDEAGLGGRLPKHGRRESWQRRRSDHFAKTRAAHYGAGRDALGEDGVSRLSPRTSARFRRASLGARSRPGRRSQQPSSGN